MGRKGLTILGAILILCGLGSFLIPRQERTIYTSYSIVATDSPLFSGAGPFIRDLAWPLLLMGCILITWMQAPKRAVFQSAVPYAIAVLAWCAATAYNYSNRPLRYHYYYRSGQHFQMTALLGGIAFLALFVGLMLSIGPRLFARRS